MTATYRVMIVCTGNICRSPMAQVVLAERLRRAGPADVAVDSAGISDEEHGNPIDPRAARVLAAHGYPVPAHRAKRITAADLAERDLVLAMTSSHARAVRLLARGDDALSGRVRMYRGFDPSAGTEGPEHLLDMDDPWSGDEAGFEVTLAQIEAAADAVVEHVREALAARGH